MISLHDDKQNVLSCHFSGTLSSVREYFKIGNICEPNIFQRIEMLLALTNSRCSINF